MFVCQPKEPPLQTVTSARKAMLIGKPAPMAQSTSAHRWADASPVHQQRLSTPVEGWRPLCAGWHEEVVLWGLLGGCDQLPSRTKPPYTQSGQVNFPTRKLCSASGYVCFQDAGHPQAAKRGRLICRGSFSQFPDVRNH